MAAALLIGRTAQADILPPLLAEVPSASVTEVFQWASVWPSNPSEEGGGSNIFYDIHMLKSLIVDGRLARYSLEQGVTDVKGNCIILGSGVALTDKSGYAQTFIHLTPNQKFLLSLLEEAQRSPMAKEFLNSSEQRDLLMCASENNFWQEGSYKSNLDIVEVKAKDAWASLDLTVEEGQSIDKESYHFQTALLTFLEEVSHSAQGNIFHTLFPEDYDNRWVADRKLWALAIEAQAKLWASFMLVEIERDKLATERTLLIAEPVKGTTDEEILKSVRGTIDEHGIDHVRANPKLLLHAFLMFFKSKESVEAYGVVGAKLFNELRGLERIPDEDFLKTFGAFPGMQGRIFDGAAQTRPGASFREEMWYAISSDTPVGRWFAAQKSALRKGKVGPSVVDKPMTIYMY